MDLDGERIRKRMRWASIILISAGVTRWSKRGAIDVSSRHAREFAKEISPGAHTRHTTAITAGHNSDNVVGPHWSLPTDLSGHRAGVRSRPPWPAKHDTVVRTRRRLRIDVSDLREKGGRVHHAVLSRPYQFIRAWNCTDRG
jgi:hypothetical protein